MNNNILTVAFGPSRTGQTRKAYQYDYGMVLKFPELSLPAAYEVHFANKETGVDSVTQIGDADGVSVPDAMFISGEPIYVWIYLHTGQDDGETVYRALVPVVKRARPSDATPDPVQQSEIDQAIAALNAAVEQTGEDADNAEASASAALASEQAAAVSATNAHNSEVAAASSAASALASKNAAGQYALNASASEANAAQSADDAEQSADRAEQAADAASDSADIASTKATEAAASASSALASAGEATTKAADASASAATASTAASTATTKAGEAAQSATNAAGSATAASGSASDANAAKLAAQAAQTAAETAQGKAEDAQAAAEDAVASVSGLSEQIEKNTSDIADLQDIVDRKAGALVDSASGSIVSVYPDKTVPNVYGLTVGIEPVQDLHGYDSPWPAGGGKNLIKPATDKTVNGVTYTNNSDGSATVNGTADGPAIFYYYQNSEDISFDTEGTWTLSGMNSTITDECYIQATVRNKSDDSIYSRKRITPSSPILTFAVTSNQYIADIFFRMSTGSSATNAKIYPMLEKSSTPTTFAPYSNICPITGWTGLNVYVSPTQDQQDATTYAVDWTSEAGTVYGGTLDVTNGVLTVDRAMVDMGTLPWQIRESLGGFSSTVTPTPKNNFAAISSCYPYKGAYSSVTDKAFGYVYFSHVFVRDSAYSNAASLKTALSGQTLVYELATPITYQLSPQDVSTIAGLNNIWADTGDVSVEYAADLKHYIDTKIAAAVAAMS